MVADQPFVKPNSPEVPVQGGENVILSESGVPKVEFLPPQGEVRNDNTIGQDDPQVDPPQSNNTDQAVQTATASTVQDADPTSAATVLDDTVELKGDDQFIGQVRKIISEDKDKPFLEESDSEDLQEKYLKSRFGVDVDLEKEAK